MVDFNKPFTFVEKTDEENSLVCLSKNTPINTLKRDDGWRAIRIQGQIDFSLIGILAKIADLLAEQQISIFIVGLLPFDYSLVISVIKTPTEPYCNKWTNERD